MMKSFKESQDQLVFKIRESESLSKELEATLKSERNKFEKDKAILDQKFSFMKDQIETLTSKLAIKEIEHSNMLELIDKDHSESEEYRNLQIAYQQHKSDSEQERENLERQIDTLKADFEERETEFNDKICAIEKHNTLR